MKLTKRILCLILAVLTLFTLIACDAEPTEPQNPGSSTPATDDNTPSTDNNHIPNDNTTPDNNDPDNGNGTPTPDHSDNGKYVIGLSAPLTGPAAVYGVSVKNAAQLAIEEINADGGLYGATFQLITIDDQHNPTMAEANYASMRENGMQVSLGCVTAAPCVAFAALAAEDNLFFLTPSASFEGFTEYANAYQMCFSDAKLGVAAAHYVRSLELSKVGILYQPDSPYSRDICDTFKATLRNDIETVEAPFTGSSLDYSAQIAQLSDCSFIFMPIFAAEAYNFMLQAKDILSADTVYYGCDAFDGMESWYDVTVIPQKITMLSQFDIKAAEGKAADFITKYTEKYGADTLNPFGAFAYDSVYAIFGAMKAAIDAGTAIPTDISASALCEILKAQFNGDYTFSGVTGENISWQDNGYVEKLPMLYVIKEKNA